MPISLGTHKVGNGQTYPKWKDVFDDVASSFIGNVSFIQSSDFENTQKATLTGVNFGASILTIDCLQPHRGIARQGFKTLLTSETELFEFNNCINGTLVIKNLNILQQAAIAVGMTKKVIKITGTSNIKVIIHDVIMRGGQRGHVAISTAAAGIVEIYANNISDFRDPGNPNDGSAIEQIGATSQIITENNSLYKLGTALRISSASPVIVNNTCFFDNTIDLGFSVGGPANNAVGKNNGTDKSGPIGFSSEAATTNLVTVPGDILSIDDTDYNFLRTNSSGKLATSGLDPDDLAIAENTAGIRGNVRGVGDTTSIGADEALRLGYVSLRNVPPQGGLGREQGGIFAESFSKNMPDRGSSFIETRVLILDHGRELPDEEGRAPEWVDITEFGGVYRLEKPPAYINIGTEGAKPFRFKASSLSLKFANHDYAFDNLKTINFITENGNPAKFLKTPEGTNYDFNYRPVKLVTRFPRSSATIGYDCGHFIVSSIETSTDGTAMIQLESLEKQFMEKSASSVKDGKNWYFDRSIKFLVQELIKSVRNENNGGRDGLVGTDTVSISGVETGDGNRIFSDYGKPIALVMPVSDEINSGEKRLTVTAAAARNIFRSKLMKAVSSGSNYITIRIDDSTLIEKGDVITIGNSNGDTFDDLNEEKVTVLQSVEFSSIVGQELNVKVSSLKKSHSAGEIVERWIIYLGCTKEIEDPIESYLITFDPDRDEFGMIMDAYTTTAGDRRLPYPPRFLHVNQQLNEYGAPAYSAPRGITLMMVASAYSYPGQPGEAARLFLWDIDPFLPWNAPHLTLAKEAGTENEGVYTGEINYRSMKPVLTGHDLGLLDPAGEMASALFGASGIGKFVEDVLHKDGVRSLGFGYIAGINANTVVAGLAVDISIVANGTEWWAVHPIEENGTPIYSGTLYLIGGSEDTEGYAEGKGESFHHPLYFYSSRITSVTKTEDNVIRYGLEQPLNAVFSKNNTVAIIIPDTGKMYVRNLGENVFINEPQDVRVAEITNIDTQKTSALDADSSLPQIYNDRIRFEKKDAIDRAKAVTAREKRKIDNTALDAGYYSAIVEKAKFEVDHGDQIQEGNINTSFGIRCVPGQYVSMPFANELWRFFTPEIPIKEIGAATCIKKRTEFSSAPVGDSPPIIFEGDLGGGIDINGNVVSIMHPFMQNMISNTGQPLKNRNIHLWNYPIIGLWAKYRELNKSLQAFDDSIIADNGNAELLGYWYLGYNQVPSMSEGDDIPRLQLAITNAEGIVKVVDDTDLPDEYFPLCSVLHNITTQRSGAGTLGLDFWGNLSTAMQNRLIAIVGGSFQVISKYQDGSDLQYSSVFGNADNGGSPILTSFRYRRWTSSGAQFISTFPMNMAGIFSNPYTATIGFKFKRLKNPQARAAMFTSLHCYPVRPRHLHLPHDNAIFDGSVDVNLRSETAKLKVEPDPNDEYTYVGKNVDTNFLSGSEEILNKGVDDTNVNFWVLDRYSQRKSLGMIAGAGIDYSHGGMLKGAKILFNGENTAKEIEIPLGYRGGGESVGGNPIIKYTMKEETFSINDVFVVSVVNNEIIFGVSVHNFTSEDIGSILKLDGFKKINGTIFVWETLDGLYRLKDYTANSIVVDRIRVNDSNWNSKWESLPSLQAYAEYGYLHRYYGLETTYQDTDVIAAYVLQHGSDQLHVTPGLSYYPLNSGDEYIYGIGPGRVIFTEVDTVDPTKLVFSWNFENGLPSESTAPIELTKDAGSGPTEMIFSAVEAENLDVFMPTFIAQETDHRDHLLAMPSGSEQYKLPFSKTFLSYHKVIFTVPPTFGNIINYPKVLYGRSWEMFWKYNERRNIEDFKRKPWDHAIAALSASNTLTNTFKPGNDRLRGSIKSNLGTFDIGSFDPGADIPWNEYAERLADFIRKNSVYFSATVSEGITTDRNAIYIFQRHAGGNNSGKSFKIKSISKITGVQKKKIQFIVGEGESLTDYWDYDDWIYLANTRSNKTDHLFVEIIDFIGTDTITGLLRTLPYNDAPIEDENESPIGALGVATGTKDFNICIQLVYDNSTRNTRYAGIDVQQFDGDNYGTQISLGENQPYGEGDGNFDSGRKPLNFGDTFINSMAKWYLSKYTIDNKIYCDTYTINHDGPFIGNDDKLYAIVNRHPIHLAPPSRWPYIRFAMGMQKNFLAMTETDKLLFARQKFIANNYELQIIGSIATFDETGIHTVRNVPYLLQGSDLDTQLISDWEIHGIFKNEGTDIPTIGLMRWHNKGNVNLSELSDGVVIFAMEHRYFSINQLNLLHLLAAPALATLEDKPRTVNAYSWQSQAANSFTIDTVNNLLVKQIEERPVRVKQNNIILTEITSGMPADGEWMVVFNGLNWTVTIGDNPPDSNDIKFGYVYANEKYDSNFRTKYIDIAGNYAYLSVMKGWTDTPNDFTLREVTKKSLRGIVMRRNDFNSSDEVKRNKREDLAVFHIEMSESGYAYFENQNELMYPFALTALREFVFRVASHNGFYFTNTRDNSLKRWNGETITTGSVVEIINEGSPVVSGDFNQYERMLKIDNPYEEVFGFSMGPRVHQATQTFQGGRNIIWKLSKSMANHIEVADFEDLNVWDALGMFAEITDCIVGFDRFGNLHFEPRPDINSDSAFFFTFDDIEQQNIVRLFKKPPYEYLYNEIEIIPYSPTLSEIAVNLTVQSELSAVTVNHDLYIRDKSLNFGEKAATKSRPVVQAYQKDFKRKRIVLICTNGQFDTENAVEKGLYSRFKYQLFENVVELRIVGDIEPDADSIVVNRIPFDSETNAAAIKIGDILFIGDLEFEIINFTVDDRRIYISPQIPSDKRYFNGTPVIIANVESRPNHFFADSDGTFPGQTDGNGTGFTYSPKTFFTEIGEWTFDITHNKKKVILTASIGPTSELIPVSDISMFAQQGNVSIAGRVISYSQIRDNSLVVSSAIPSDLSAGLEVIPMPVNPSVFKLTNFDYNPGQYRIGGYDELGPSCLDEYHLLDPNEDGQPYYSADPLLGGRPITALEFYSKEQVRISYPDGITLPAGNASGKTNVENDDGDINYRVRHRTHVGLRIDFNGFRFGNGDRIDLDIPGIKLSPQEHLRQVYADAESIKRNGLRPYPQTNNRFFTPATAGVFGKRNLKRISRIGNDIEITGYVDDITDLNWLTPIRIRHSQMFATYPNREVRGYISNMKFDQYTGQVTMSVLTQAT